MITRTALALLTGLAAAPASAQGVYPYAAVATGEGDFAGPFVRGTYIGAPLTRVPRPSQIVPAPWSYGTYGVPTVSGIAAAPAQPPTITVINATNTAANRAAGAQVISVQVPRR